MPDKYTQDTVTEAAADWTREPGLEDEATASAPQTKVKSHAPTPRTQASRPVATTDAAARPDNLTRNVLFCVGGLVLGFLLGFFLANKMSVAPRPQTATAAPAEGTDGVAPPLDPAQTTGELPPGHPNVGGANGANSGSAAATSADAQQAMAAADDRPKDFDLQMSAAATFYKAGDLDKALVYLQRAVELKPKDVDALTALGNTKYDKGDFTGATEYYQRVLAIQPQNTDVQTDLGNAYFRRTPPDYARAIAEYRKTLAIDPKHEKALQNIAAAALQIQDRETARTAIDQLAAANPTNPTIAPLRESLNALP